MDRYSAYKITRDQADRKSARCECKVKLNTRKQENRNKHIGYGHVNHQQINWLFQSFRLEDNYFNEGVSSQRNRK